MQETELLTLFDLEITKALINFKWPIIKEKTITFLLYPFIAYLATTVIYTQTILHAKVNGEPLNWILDLVLIESMWVFSLWFLLLELLQMRGDGSAYFYSLWNYIDIVPPAINIYITTAISYGLYR